ncbi:Scribble [Lamellibrachia satsuma]|nr:Scribble [Lamellibrachia satsuma]
MRYTRTLEELLLDANQIRELPKAFFRLLQLRKLSLSDNEVGRLPPDIANFMNLVELDVSKNDITDIPENIKFCKSLQEVDFSSNPLQRLPDSFTQLRNLTHLALNDVSLARLPPDIGSLSNLLSLELRENLLKYLPSSLSFLVKLQTLDLGCNMLDELPETVGSLPSLEELWLDCNELIELPRELGRLKRLTQLDVSENKLERLPEEIGGLVSLTDLLLSQNQLEFLPDGIGELRKLTILKVDQNHLLQLTITIGNCISLQELILTENLISELPTSVGKLKNLSNFNVDRNRISDLPKEIGQCVRLGVLSLRDNRIMFLPMEVGNLKELHVMDVSGNRLLYLPITITLCNLKALWLSENQAQPMLKFQTDFDDATGQKVLTCFLLPQQAYHTESMENLLRGSVATDQDSRLSWNDRSWTGETTRSSVKFAGEEADDRHNSDDEDNHFVRHNTPHPKELKARHPKVFAKTSKDVDGHVIPHNPEKKSEEVSFMPSRDTRWRSDAHDGVTPPSNDVTMNALDDSAVFEDVKPKPSVVTVTMRDKPTEEKTTKFAEDPTSPKSDDLDSSQEYREKHVGFCDDDSDYFEPDMEGKLRRRDTPHHLKNKRINSMETPESAEEKVRAILAAVSQKRPATPPPPKMGEEEEEEEEEEEVARTGMTAPIEERHTLRIIRLPGKGLGISIAGGQGSTPYKDDDEGIFISRVTEEGPAGQAGLRVGDKVLAVNNEDLVGADHHRAVAVLKEAGNDVTMVVARETTPAPAFQQPTEVIEETKAAPARNSLPQPDVEICGETITITIRRNMNGLGFSIAGGRGSTPYKDEETSKTINSIYISRITEGGAADLDGNMQVGDRIISINGVDMTDATHEDAVGLLTGATNEITLVVYHEKLVVMEQSRSPTVLTPPLSPTHNDIRAMPTSPSVKMLSSAPLEAKMEAPRSVQLESGPVLAPPRPAVPTPRPVVAPRPSWATPPAPPVRTSSAPGNNSQTVMAATAAARTSFLQSPATPTTPVNETTVISATKTVTQSPAVVSPVSNIRPESFNHEGYGAEPYPVETVRILKAGGPLGLSIVGGVDHTSHPFGIHEPGVFVSKIVPGGAAARTNLKIGDRILKVNSKDVRAAKHQDVVMCLISPASEIVLEIRHDPPPPGLRELVIHRSLGDKLGIGIKGGAHSPPGNPLDNTDEGIFLYKIRPGGAIAKDGHLKVGDRLLEINGQSLLGATYQEAVRVLRMAADPMTMLVCDGFSPSCIERSLSKQIGRPLQASLWSIDRDDEEAVYINKEHEAMREAAQFERDNIKKIEQVKQEHERQADDNEIRFADDDDDDERVSEPQGNKQHLSQLEMTPPRVARRPELPIIVPHPYKTSLSSSVLSPLPTATPVIRFQPPTSPVQSNIPAAVSSNTATKRPVPAPRQRAAVHVQGVATSVPPLSTNTQSMEAPLVPTRSPLLSPHKPLKSTLLPQCSGGDDNISLMTTSPGTFDPIRMSRKPAAQSPCVSNLSQRSEPVVMTTSDGMPLNFVAKMKYFEKEIAEQKGPKPKEEKTFSYLQDHEVAQLRREEEEKTSSMSEEDLRQYRQETVGFDNAEMDKLMSSKPQVIRTAKAERRSQGQLVQPPSERKESLSPAEERALQAEKRSAWRQARMKSLEEDAMRAQAVIQREQRLRQSLASVDENSMGERNQANGRIREHALASSVPCRRLVLNSCPGNTRVYETTRVLDEKVTRKVEQYEDPATGKLGFKTVEYIEKVVEHKVGGVREGAVEGVQQAAGLG